MLGAVVLDVLDRLLAERFARRDDRVVRLAHRLRREVGVRARAVPVALRPASGRASPRRRSPRRCGRAANAPSRAGRRRRAATSGPTWNSHWPGMTSALMPEMPRAGFEARVEVRFDDVTAEHLVGADTAVVEALRRRESAASGKPCGRPPLKNVYSCSMPNSGSCARVLLGDRREHARACWSGAASCRAAAPRSSRARCRRRGSGRDTTNTGLQHAVGVPARRLVRARTVEAPDRQVGSPSCRRGSSSSTAAERSARCRRSRCTPP